MSNICSGAVNTDGDDSSRRAWILSFLEPLPLHTLNKELAGQPSDLESEWNGVNVCSHFSGKQPACSTIAPPKLLLITCAAMETQNKLMFKDCEGKYKVFKSENLLRIGGRSRFPPPSYRN